MLGECFLIFMGVMLGVGIIGEAGLLLIEFYHLKEAKKIRRLKQRDE